MTKREIKTGTLTADEVTQEKVKVEYFTLDETAITNQYVELQFTPISLTDVSLDVIGGIAQMPGVDFNLTDNQLNFIGALATGGDSALVEGDRLRVLYRYL